MRRPRLPAPIILAHGGAGARAMTKGQRACLIEALAAGCELLRRDAPSLDAVEATIRVLEGSGVFNAGVGAQLQLDGVKRMDASIMEGRHLRAGAVAGIEEVRHPITAAKLVMEETAHVLLAGPQATKFARHFKLDRQLPPEKVRRTTRVSRADLTGLQQKTRDLFVQMDKASRMRREARDTVGAVALDRNGTVAAGASTGGIALMLPGRVGDTPLIGCGCYADDEAGAVSMTGWGESIIRLAVAKTIADRMASGATPVAAVRWVLSRLGSRIRGQAGALVLAPNGKFAIRHNTPYMVAGHWSGRGKPVVQDRFG